MGDETDKKPETLGMGPLELPPRPKTVIYVAPPTKTVTVFSSAAMERLTQLDGKPLGVEKQMGFRQFLDMVIKITVKQANKHEE